MIVEQINPKTLLYFDPLHLLGMHKCLGEIEPERVGKLIGDDEVRNLYPPSSTRPGNSFELPPVEGKIVGDNSPSLSNMT